MPEQHNRSGILYRVKEKRGEKSPDFTGYCTIDGRKFDLAGWVNEGQHGKFLSIKITDQKERSDRR